MINKMAIALIIIGGLLLVIGMWLALKSVKPMYFNVIAGVIILIGTLFGLFGKQLQDKNSSDKSDKILKTGESTVEKVDNLKIQNNELSTKIENQAQTIDKLRTENSDLYSKLAIASKDIYKKITGGDSYCVFEVFFDGAGTPAFHLRFVGTTPLKNVQISIEDFGRRSFLIESSGIKDYKSPVISQIIQNTYYNLEYASLYPNTLVKVPIPIEKGQKDVRMKIWINLDNGALFEFLEVNNFRENSRTCKLELKRGDEVLINR